MPFDGGDEDGSAHAWLRLRESAGQTNPPMEGLRS
jgi:hypothetical protein